ncbi:MAG: FAD-binding oxidoreductase [Vitreoscilla sp.]|nr:FAD-binding oxidoreductase [Vitreoscilla sp.]
MSFLSIDRDLARDSYYAATVQRGPGYPALTGAIECDVAVVGGGLAGLSAALELAQRGLQVVLLEAKEVAWGASGRNGGQAIHGLACDQETIESQLGLDDAKRIWAMSLEAIDLIRERMATHRIDCDWRDGYLGLATTRRKAAELAEWADRMAEVYGHEFTRIGEADVRRWIASPRYVGGIHDPHSGHLHPLKYSLGIARAAAEAGVRMFENSPVTRVEQGAAVRLTTAQGEVRARQALLAGNVYLQGVAEGLETRIMPVGTYIVCSERIDPALCDSLVPSRSAVCDTNFVLDYFRPTSDHRMLYGGRVSYSTMTPHNLADSMRQRMVGTFPQLAGTGIEYAWGGFVDITMNRAPDFGRLGSNLYYLQGFSGHGLALTGLAGRLVAEAMQGDASRFDVFARLKHHGFPGGRWLRTPALVLGMAWYRLRDILG